MDDLSPPARQPRRRQRRARAPALELTDGRADAALRRDAAVVAIGGAAMPMTVDGVAVAAVDADRRSPPARSSRVGAVDGPGLRATLAVRGGIDVAAVPRQRLDVHARRVRRPRGPGAGAPATCSRSATDAGAAPPRRSPPGWRRVLDHDVGARRARSARTPRPSSSPPAGLDALLRRRVAGALQLGAHRRAPRRPAPAVGARRRRRGRPAPVEHPRHRLRHRRGRPHRRHAGHPRPRRPEPRRLRVPGRRGGGRAVEARPAGARATACASCRGPPTEAAAADDRRAALAGPGDDDRSSRSPARRGTARSAPPRLVATTACSPAREPTATTPASRTAGPATGSCSSSTAPMALDLGAARPGPRARALGRASTSRRRRRRHRRRPLAARPGRRRAS